MLHHKNKGQAPPPILNRIKIYLNSIRPRSIISGKKSPSSKLVGGQALLIVSAFVGIVLIFGFITVSNTTQFNRTINIIDERAIAKQAAEAGLAKSIWCLNQANGDNCGGTFGSSYSGESDVFIGNASFSTSITDKDSNTKTITSTGFFPNSTSTRYSIAVKQEAAVNTNGISFYFGAQVGDGGLEMEHDSLVENGNVYSNGNIEGEGEIDGDVFVAGGEAPVAATEWTSKNNDFIFGKTSSIEDIAQSFSIPNSGKVTRVSLYIKKISGHSYPSNATIRIQTDSGSKPSGSTIGSGALLASLVTGTMTWLSFTLSSQPTLSAGQKYWLVIDSAGYSSDGYWISGQDTTGGYPSHTGMKYKSSNPGKGWYDAGGDFNFKIWVGGVATRIHGIEVDGDVHANTIDSCDIDSGGNAYATIIKNWTDVEGDAYTDEIYNSYVHGTTYLGQGPEDPPMQNFPISDAQIAEWKKDASDGGTINGDYEPDESSTVYLGPIKITGDLILENKQHLILTGGVYVQGNLEIGNQATVRLDPSYGQSSGFIIADGTLHVENHGGFSGSGEEGSTLLLAALAAGGGHHDSAIDLHNNATGAVFYAPNGLIYLHNLVHVTELTGKKIHLSEHAHLNYETGLADAVFTSGPGGAWELKTGTWRIIK